jgi:hypothetical protein
MIKHEQEMMKQKKLKTRAREQLKLISKHIILETIVLDPAQ